MTPDQAYFGPPEHAADPLGSLTPGRGSTYRSGKNCLNKRGHLTGNFQEHGGSFRNPTTGPLIDRQTLIEQATRAGPR